MFAKMNEVKCITSRKQLMVFVACDKIQALKRILEF